jgi:hypothetical protein
LTNSENEIINIIRLLNFIEICLDPIIIGALDVHFWKTWRQLWLQLRNKCFRSVERQAKPASTISTIQRVKKQDETVV